MVGIVLAIAIVGATIEKIHNSIVDKRMEVHCESVMPYESIYGQNMVYAPNTIKVHAPSDRDLIVIVRDSYLDNVVSHFYIAAGETNGAVIPNGTFQVYFYSGRGWDENKKMKSSRGDKVIGGFRYHESFGKDPKTISFGDGKFDEVSYDLNKRRNGNMHESHSRASQMF